MAKENLTPLGTLTTMTDDELCAALQEVDETLCDNQRTEQALTVRADRITRELERREAERWEDPAEEDMQS
jgi:uncharacterized protein YqgV (UPF0045/DUF77 family)